MNTEHRDKSHINRQAQHAHIDVRRDCVARYYKQGYPIRKICELIKQDLGLPTYSTQTCHKDIQALLTEWRKRRIEDMDLAVQLELERIDDICREAWKAWEKSKKDHTLTSTSKDGLASGRGSENEEITIKTTHVGEQRKEVVVCGDTRYLQVIHNALIERRKLLGLYAPEKKELSGSLSFEDALMQTGVLDDEE